jgi:hypothetical protein
MVVRIKIKYFESIFMHLWHFLKFFIYKLKFILVPLSLGHRIKRKRKGKKHGTRDFLSRRLVGLVKRDILVS